MEENEKIHQVEVSRPEVDKLQGASESSERTKVTFPGNQRKKRRGKKIIIPLILIVIILLVAAWFIFFKDEGFSLSSEITPTPTSYEEEKFPTPTSEPTEIERSEVKIEILNGTGIGGEAAFLQKELGNLGYENIEVGNADDQDNETTVVTFGNSVPKEIKDEIKDKLDGIYKDLEVESGGVAGKNIEIIAGLRKGQSFPTKAPTAKPTAGATSTPTPTGAEATSTQTPTPTEIPTQNP